ncbi:MAG: bile acid:sodium symporter family protein [Pseudomonadota bacterium]
MGQFLVDVALPLILAFIMATLGLGLRPADFTRVLAVPRAFGVGFVNQMLFLPVVGFALAATLGLGPELAVGLVILALCPGGVTTNLLTKIGGGNVALSITLTAVVTMVSVATLPWLLGFSVGFFLGGEDGAAPPPVDTAALSVAIFAMTLAPVALGMGLRAAAPEFTDRAAPTLNRLAVIFFALIVLAAIATNWATLVENIGRLGPATAGLMAVMMVVGTVTARLAGLNRADETTVVIETGVQNSTLGIAVAAILAAQLGGSGEGFSPYALPAAAYGVLMYLLAVPFALWRRRG